MSESSSHLSLVALLAHWICANCLTGDPGLMLVDHPDFTRLSRPPKIHGYLPDVYVRDTRHSQLVIGEAKTRWDLQTKHTLDQLTAFLETRDSGLTTRLVLAVPWDMTRLARSILARICRDLDIPSNGHVVLDQLPG